MLSPLADTHVPSTYSFLFTPSLALATRQDESYPLGTCAFREKLYRIQQEFSFTSPLEKPPKLYVCVGNIEYWLWLNQLRYRIFRT